MQGEREKEKEIVSDAERMSKQGNEREKEKITNPSFI